MNKSTLTQTMHDLRQVRAGHAKNAVNIINGQWRSGAGQLNQVQTIVRELGQLHSAKVGSGRGLPESDVCGAAINCSSRGIRSGIQVVAATCSTTRVITGLTPVH